VRTVGLSQRKNPNTTSGIEPATSGLFRSPSTKCATAYPKHIVFYIYSRIVSLLPYLIIRYLRLENCQTIRACIWLLFVYFLWLCSPVRTMASSFTRFLGHTQRHAAVGWTPLEKLSARSTDLYLKHTQQTSMSPVGFKNTIAVGERP
jgi:hypothetical protein